MTKKTLYAALTTDERAKVTLHHIARNNESEIAQVMRSVPMQRQRGLDLAYTGRMDGLLAMANFWAIEHWKAQYKALLAQTWSGAADEDDPRLLELRAALRYFDTRLAALDTALDDICRANGVDADDIRTMAGAEPYSAIYEASAAPGEVEALKDALNALLVAPRGL